MERRCQVQVLIDDDSSYAHVGGQPSISHRIKNRDCYFMLIIFHLFFRIISLTYYSYAMHKERRAL